MTKVFIDGKAGTTGLKIYDRLSQRSDLELLTLPEDLRKDTAARKEMLDSADIAFLCLPDAAAREAVSLIDNPDTVVIDTSTAHRTNPDWAYGFAELSDEPIIITELFEMIDESIPKDFILKRLEMLHRQIFLIERT